LSAPCGVAEQLVLSPNNEWFYCTFCAVIVDVEPAIFDIANEFVPLVQVLRDVFTVQRVAKPFFGIIEKDIMYKEYAAQ